MVHSTRGPARTQKDHDQGIEFPEFCFRKAGENRQEHVMCGTPARIEAVLLLLQGICSKRAQEPRGTPRPRPARAANSPLQNAADPAVCYCGRRWSRRRAPKSPPRLLLQEEIRSNALKFSKSSIKKQGRAGESRHFADRQPGILGTKREYRPRVARNQDVAT